MNQLLKYMRACAVCGGHLGQISVMCKRCESQLSESSSEAQSILVSGLSVSYLYGWTEKTEVQCRTLALALKGAHSHHAFDHLSDLFIWKYRNQLRGLSRTTVLVPCPARERGREHACLLAQKLGSKLSIPVVEALEITKDSRPQKLKGKKERSTLKMNLTENLSKNLSVLFVDDVVTTGATARAAHTALMSRKNFQVWALTCRLD